MNIMKINGISNQQYVKRNKPATTNPTTTKPCPTDSVSFKAVTSPEAYMKVFDNEFNLLVKGESGVRKCFNRLHEAATTLNNAIYRADFSKWLNRYEIKGILGFLTRPGRGDEYYDQLAEIAKKPFPLVSTLDNKIVTTITNYGKFEDENLLSRLARGYSDRHIEVDFFDLDPNNDRRITFGLNYYDQLKLSQIDNKTGFFRQRTIFSDHKGIRQEIVSSPDNFSEAIITNYNEDGTKFTTTDEVVDVLANGMYKIFGKIFS